MAYKFEFISDTRFGGKKTDIIEWDRQLKNENIKIVREFGIQQVNFMRKDISPIDRGMQWRKSYIIDRKEGQSWKDVFGIINSIKVVRFERTH